MAKEQHKTGPPLGNMNRLKTGTGLKINRLTIGDVPAPMRRQLQNARKYRRMLEGLVAESKGIVTTTDAHVIDAAVGAEMHAAICRWLLRNRLDKMTVSDITRCSEQIVKAKDSRNRAIKQLDLDRDARENILEALYSREQKQLETET